MNQGLFIKEKCDSEPLSLSAKNPFSTILDSSCSNKLVSLFKLSTVISFTADGISTTGLSVLICVPKGIECIYLSGCAKSPNVLAGKAKLTTANRIKSFKYLIVNHWSILLVEVRLQPKTPENMAADDIEDFCPTQNEDIDIHR